MNFLRNICAAKLLKHKCVLLTSLLYLIIFSVLAVTIHNKFTSSEKDDMKNFNNCTVPCDSFHRTLARAERFCTDQTMMHDTEETLKERYGNYSSGEEKKMLARKVHLVAFGNDRFKASKRRLLDEAKQYKIFSSISIYGPNDLSYVFRGYFKNVLKQIRGGGYWIWKFYVIRLALEQAKENEFVFYLDSGSSLIPNTQTRFAQYLLMLDRSNYSFLAHEGGPYKEEYFMSGPLLSLFQLRDNTQFLDSIQISAAFILAKRTNESIRLLDTALKILHIDQNLATDYYGNCCTPPRFKENRHDQSIFTALLKCNGFVWMDETYRDKCKKGVACLTRKRE